MNSQVDTISFMKHRVTNLLQTFLLLAMVFGFLCSFAYLFFDILGIWMVFWVLFLLLVFGNQISPQLILGMHRAVPLSEYEAPQLYSMAREIAKRANIHSKINLFYTPEINLNAFFTGTRSTPCVALSEGLLRSLNHREIAGVLAHEISHIANGDLAITVFGQIMGRVISGLTLFGQILVWLNLPLILTGNISIPLWLLFSLAGAPMLVQLILLKLSRTREYDADAVAARLTGDPDGLSSALAKIGRIHKSFFAKLLSNSVNVPEWLSTHPPTEKRVEKIMALKRQDHHLPPMGALNEIAKQLAYRDLRNSSYGSPWIRLRL